MINGMIGGAIGGLIGAMAWAGVTYVTGYEIGWLAWGIGVLVGVGHAAGYRAGGPAAGVSAVIISVLALMVGKYASVGLMMGDWAGDFRQEMLVELQDDDQAIAYMADQIILKLEESGRPVDWPDDDALDDAMEARDFYPANVWAEAADQWYSMDAQEQQAFREYAVTSLESDINDLHDSLTSVGFLLAFGLFDIVFFGLAMAAAYKIASAENDVANTDASIQAGPPVTQQFHPAVTGLGEADLADPVDDDALAGADHQSIPDEVKGS